MGGEILVVPFFGQGHLFPCVELCKHLVARGFKATLMIPSSLESSVAASVRENPEIEILEIDSGGMEGLLAERFKRSKPVCAVVDNMMSSSKEVLRRFGIRTVSFFTSGACNAAVEHCMWKAGVTEDVIKPGETRTLPGLPQEMAVSYSEIKRNFGPPLNGPPPFGAGPPSDPPMFGAGPPSDPPMFGAGPPRGPPVFGGPLVRMPGFGGGPPGLPPRLGGAPHWIHEVEGSVGLMVNSCDELELPFIGYLSKNLDLPVWGVGPLLPEDYWKSSGELVRDGKFRANRRSNYSEDEVLEWLDSKPKASVLYASFGSEVGPSKEEYEQLALALGESRRPFIWVLQQNAGKHGPPPGLFGGSVNPRESDEGGYFPHDLAGKVGQRGLIIRGWAPQLMILSHPSTGGFLSHCGWNSTVEAIGRGIPFLAWPIRGDQFFNAKLVVSLLKTGYMVADDFSRSVEKEHIAKGMELLMSDEEMKNRAEAFAAGFGKCFPPSSVAALDAFRDFISSPE